MRDKEDKTGEDQIPNHYELREEVVATFGDVVITGDDLFGQKED